MAFFVVCNPDGIVVRGGQVPDSDWVPLQAHGSGETAYEVDRQYEDWKYRMVDGVLTTM
jgi:hypothetical protein